jgi:hypothetical protein
MEKLIESMRKTLAELGLDEETINAAIEKIVADAQSEENPQPSGDPVPPTEPTDELPVPPVPPEEEVPGEGPSPDPSAVDAQVESEGDPIPPQEVPPVEEPTPAPAPVPPFDPTELIAKVEEVTQANEELKKANEGLLQRVASLEEALKKAGVIDGSSLAQSVGDENPAAAPQNPTSDVFSDTLRELNGGKRF